MLRRLSYPSAQASEFIKRLHYRHLSQPPATGKTQEIFGEPLAPIEVVRRILDDVRRQGDAAVLRYGRAFDGAELTASRLSVEKSRLKQAFEGLDKRVRSALLRAKEAIAAYQRALLPADVLLEPSAGVRLWGLFRPLRRVGVYVPGGTASYPSSVLMNVVPAMVAGVEEVALFTPPEPSDAVLAACYIAGIEEVYRVGGVQAIAAMAYGTESIQRVDFIAGPGNIYVVLAKHEVYGLVGIDLLAGPSEVMIIADATADAALIAADMLAQAEHDRLASATVACTETRIIDAVEEELGQRVGAPPLASGEHRQDEAVVRRSLVAAASLADFGAAFIVADLPAACALANEIAPEHLEIMTERPRALLAAIRTAGAVFLGSTTPEAVGDYVAGPSHTLPTSGSARFSSGLSALSFLRRMSAVEYDPGAFREAAENLVSLAEVEGLPYHAESVRSRRTHTHLREESGGR